MLFERPPLQADIARSKERARAKLQTWGHTWSFDNCLPPLPRPCSCLPNSLLKPPSFRTPTPTTTSLAFWGLEKAELGGTKPPRRVSKLAGCVIPWVYSTLHWLTRFFNVTPGQQGFVSSQRAEPANEIDSLSKRVSHGQEYAEGRKAGTKWESGASILNSAPLTPSLHHPCTPVEHPLGNRQWLLCQNPFAIFSSLVDEKWFQPCNFLPNIWKYITPPLFVWWD